MNPLLIAKALSAIIAVVAIFYVGQRYERSGWLEKEIAQQKALQAETQRVMEAQTLAAQKRSELEVKNVELTKIRGDLANINRVATERLRIIASRPASNPTTTTTTSGGTVDTAETERVLSIKLAQAEKLFLGVDRLGLEADEINDAYISCRGQ